MQRIGFIGLRNMGGGIAEHLAQSGYPRVHNGTRSTCEGAEELGARIADSPPRKPMR